MADTNPSLATRILSSLTRDGSGTGNDPYRPANPLAKLVSPIDNGLYALHQYGKQAGPLPVTPFMQVNHLADKGLDAAANAVRGIIHQYGTQPPAPTAPAPPTAPAYATDPEDRGRSMGVAIRKPGGWY